MQKNEQIIYKQTKTENSDIEYILDLFDSEQLNLTITEDTQQNQRSSMIYSRKSSQDIREDISENKYRFSFLNFFKKHREQAVIFIDSAIRFMNTIKKMKIEEVLSSLNKEDIMNDVMNRLVTPEILIQPIKDELMYAQLSEKDIKKYEQILQLLQRPQSTTEEFKNTILKLLSQIQAN